jgi:hypothetical protein
MSPDIIIPEVFLEYEGITIYHTYQFDDRISYQHSSHVFTTSLDGTYSSDPFRFDIRTLTVPAVSDFEDNVRAGEGTAVIAVLEQAIDRGMLATPDAGSDYRPVQVHQQTW